MISAEVLGAQKTIALLDALHPKAKEYIRDSVNREGLNLLRMVKEEFLTGQALNVRTGTLRRSINLKVENPTEGEYSGAVGTNLVYAKIHELGGQTKPHIIEPRNAKILVWAGIGTFGKGETKATGRLTKKGYKAQGAAGNLTFARVVHHPGSKIPARPFLKPALIARTPEIQAALARAMDRAIRAGSLL